MSALDPQTFFELGRHKPHLGNAMLLDFIEELLQPSGVRVSALPREVARTAFREPGSYVRAVRSRGYTGWVKYEPKPSELFFTFGWWPVLPLARRRSAARPPVLRGMPRLTAILDDANFFSAPSVPAYHRA
jgi:hypothetical protein